LRYALGLVGFLVFLSCANAQDKCPVEVKLLLSSPAPEPVIAALHFKKKEVKSHIYFFDTESLDLLRAGVIIRIRQGATNDLTVKLRLPKRPGSEDPSELQSHFACEIDRTGTATDLSLAVGRKYHAATNVPALGREIEHLLSPSQKSLLVTGGVTVDWNRVVRLANISATKWQTSSKTPQGKLALELWNWPDGSVLEISAKSAPGSASAKYDELTALLESKRLPLNPLQGTKTTTVLQTLVTHGSATCRPNSETQAPC
jgi:hypothetical protein